MSDVESHGDRLDVSVFVGFTIVGTIVCALVYAYFYFVSVPMTIDTRIKPAVIAKCARLVADGDIEAKGSPRDHCACMAQVAALDWPVGLATLNRMSLGLIGDLEASTAALFNQAQIECLQR